MTETKIVGDGWKIYVDEAAGLWRGDGAGVDVPLKMLLGHFDYKAIQDYADSGTYLGRKYGMLYPKAAEFLRNWGIKCSVENLPQVISEQLPLPSPD